MEGVSPGDFSTSPCIFNPFAPRIEWKQLTDLLKDPEILSGSFNTSKKKTRQRDSEVGVCARDTCSWLWMLVGEGSPFVRSLFIW